LARDLRVQWRTASSLRPYGRNARTHSKKQIRQVAKSIETFGWTNPLLIDTQGGVIAGHARLDAAKLIGLTDVPTLLIDHLSETQKRAYIIADNKLAELAGWDEEILAAEFEALTSLDLDFDLTITGFETGEIDFLIEGVEPVDDDEEDWLADAAQTGAPVSRLGDLWVLGQHRLLCGDARDPAAYEDLMADARAHMVFTDPPYNVPIDGHVCGLGRITHREFPMAAGEMSAAEFTAFLETACRNMTAVSIDGALHFICMDWRHIHELLTAGRQVYSELKNLCVWVKTGPGMGSFFRSQHELVAVFKHGRAPHTNNIQLGRYGRSRSNVWAYEGANSLNPDRRSELALHPTVKPVRLVADALQDASNRGDGVLDPFCGSGTILIAAEKVGRRAYAMELDPLYVDTAVARWEAMTGKSACHGETGRAFADLKAEHLAGFGSIMTTPGTPEPSRHKAGD
jgi:DNA modification methylase